LMMMRTSQSADVCRALADGWICVCFEHKALVREARMCAADHLRAPTRHVPADEFNLQKRWNRYESKPAVSPPHALPQAQSAHLKPPAPARRAPLRPFAARQHAHALAVDAARARAAAALDALLALAGLAQGLAAFEAGCGHALVALDVGHAAGRPNEFAASLPGGRGDDGRGGRQRRRRQAGARDGRAREGGCYGWR